MRLAIDPFPVLLMDEEILYRCFNSMTDPYSDEFVEKYIGEDTFAAYRTTEIYQITYESFMAKEKKTPAVFNAQSIITLILKKNELLQQLSLMTKADIISVLMVYVCDKVVKTYCSGGLQMYFTEKNTNRRAMSFSSDDFNRFAELKDKINQPYDEAYISVFVFDDEPYYVEHNELLSSDDVAQIIGVVAGALFKMNEQPTET